MPGPFQYTNSPIFGPTAAPTCSIEFSDGISRVPVIALIDSGASASRIPYNVILRLGLHPIGEDLYEEVDDTVHIGELYSVNIDFVGFRFMHYPVFRYNKDFAIIGRDILNRYFVQLNGPTLNMRVDEVLAAQ